MNKYTISYGICDHFQFPCFARLIFQSKGNYVIQEKTKTGISLRPIVVENAENLLKLEYKNKINLDSPLYCIVLKSNEYYIGGPKELKSKLDNIVPHYSLFFQERYYKFTHNAWRLLETYQLMQRSKFSESTRQMAKVQYNKMIRTMMKILTLATNSYDLSLLNYLEEASNFEMIMKCFLTYRKIKQELVNSIKIKKEGLLVTKVPLGKVRVKIPITLPQKSKTKIIDSGLLKDNDYGITFLKSFNWI